MGRMLRLAVAVLVGLSGGLVGVTSAEAHAVHAHYGNRGHAWTNNGHNRVGVEDQRDDGIIIFVYVEWRGSAGYGIFIVEDENNSRPGHTAQSAPGPILSIQICGWRNGEDSTRSCGRQVPVR